LEWVLEKHPFRHSWFTSEESKHPGKEDEAPSIASNSNDHDLKKENEFLKDHVMRLSKELRIQQNQQHSEAGSPKIESKFDILELPQWMLDSSVMSPIFTSYDSRVRELASFVEQQGAK